MRGGSKRSGSFLYDGSGGNINVSSVVFDALGRVGRSFYTAGRRISRLEPFLHGRMDDHSCDRHFAVKILSRLEKHDYELESPRLCGSHSRLVRIRDPSDHAGWLRPRPFGPEGFRTSIRIASTTTMAGAIKLYHKKAISMLEKWMNRMMACAIKAAMNTAVPCTCLLYTSPSPRD